MKLNQGDEKLLILYIWIKMTRESENPILGDSSAPTASGDSEYMYSASISCSSGDPFL